MKTFFSILLFAIVSWQLYLAYENHHTSDTLAQNTEETSSTPRIEISWSDSKKSYKKTSPSIPENKKIAKTSIYQCDGRTHCSQMTSCSEATFFLNNCPDAKMDGDGNGVPCEKQWCGN